MRVLCISTSNTKFKGSESASTKVCGLIKEILNDTHDVTILPLMDYEMNACMLCGDCIEEQLCHYDEPFNTIYKQICEHDAIFFVVPHYSPIPSKLIMVFEKLNEIFYTTYIRDKNIDHLPYKGKRVGIIGHGGMTESDKVLKYYHDYLLKPVYNTLRGLSFNVIGESEEFPYGSVFGLQNNECIVEKEGQLPDIIQDYDEIKERIKPLVHKVVESN